MADTERPRTTSRKLKAAGPKARGPKSPRRKTSTTRYKDPGAFVTSVRKATAGFGLFAEEPIPKKARIIEYVGDMLTEDAYQKSQSSYLFDVGPGGGALDGAPRWNLARYINHSCKPNCEPEVKNRRVFIHARRDIKPGEELTYNYGKEYFDTHIGEHCRCVKCAPKMHGDAGIPAAGAKPAKGKARKADQAGAAATGATRPARTTKR